MSTPSELYPYTLPRIELFHSDCLSELPIWMHGIYCLCEQTAKVDRSHYNIILCHNKLIRNFNLFQPYRFSKFSDRLYTCIVNNCYTDTCTQNKLCIIVRANLCSEFVVANTLAKWKKSWSHLKLTLAKFLTCESSICI